MESARLQKCVKLSRVVGGQRIGSEELVAVAAVGREHAPGEQAAHVQLFDPGIGQDIVWQLKTEFCTCDILGIRLETLFVL